MRPLRFQWLHILSLTLVVAPLACAAAPPPSSSAPSTGPSGKLPHLTIDMPNKSVRVEAEMLGVDAPLEFFCVQSGTNEHESVLRSPVKASHLHLAMLIVGLEPGKPLTYNEASKSWTPPHGPPLHIDLEWTDVKGKKHTVPAYRTMRNVKTKKSMPALTWVFTGSRVMEDGNYAADVTGYLVSVVNFDLTVIDIPQLASSSNDLLEWERNPDTTPAPGTRCTMVIRPAGKDDPTTAPAKKSEAQRSSVQQSEATTTAAGSTTQLSDVAVNEVLVDELQKRWQDAVTPHKSELRVAAQTHYDVINELRQEQQRIIDEADKVQRLIDRLETEYRDLTTPRPKPVD